MSQLNIYRASAGSGKTFKLIENYLKLLFKNPSNYKHILAVTFTNKAADEMKSRIIKEINNLAKGRESNYINILSREFNLKPQDLKEKAQNILNNILHDYSRFSVGTIDSFFQRVIHSFTKEIGLQAGFNIELDDTQVLSEVIDRLLIDIDNTPDKSGLKNWLIRFAETKIEEGKSWNLKNDINNLGKEIFKEEYKSFDKALIQKIENKEFLNNYFKSLNKVKYDFENTLKKIGDKAIEIISNHYLSLTDFSYKETGVAGYFYKISEKKNFIPGKRVIDAHNEMEKWYSKSTASDIKTNIENAYNDGLNELLVQALDYYNTNCYVYNTVAQISAFFYTLGILTDISKKILDYTDEKNIFLISDAAILLQEIIGDNDAPFIYEKLGNIYKHFMIDEFQDTSRLQWSNFKPLINNSLSENNTSLVVGDVKQSIYRWRNSDWKLLSEQVVKDVQNFGANSIALNTNWRSKKNIVDFNNTIFQYAARSLQEQFNQYQPLLNPPQRGGLFHPFLQVDNEILADLKTKLTKAYQDLEQHLPEKNSHSSTNGYVNISFIENTEDENLPAEALAQAGWKDIVKQKLPKLIEDLQDNNYQLKDIAIIVREKNEGKEIADALLAYKNSDKAQDAYKYDVISNESLFIENSPVVCFILFVLKYFNNPSDTINNASLIHQYKRYINRTSSCSPTANAEMSVANAKDNSNEELFKKHFPGSFINGIERLKQLPLFELVEQLSNIFSLNSITEDVPYLLAFQDIVLKFTQNETGDICSFLEWWEKNAKNQAINFSEQQDAIRIITIHKAKGLEFKAVIIPFCNWLIDHNPHHTNILWCKPDVEPFNKLELIPVKYTSKLSETIFYEEYFTEKLHAYVDNLNLLYVAFTRAKDVLYTFSPLKADVVSSQVETPDSTLKDNRKITNVSELLYRLVPHLNLSAGSEGGIFNNRVGGLDNYWNEKLQCFEMGKLSKIYPVKSVEQFKANEIKLKNYPSFPIKERIKIKVNTVK